VSASAPGFKSAHRPRRRPARPPITIPLASDFSFGHEPIQTLSNRQFVGRIDEINDFVTRIEHSAGGSFLITGYRGVGKTSFVNEALSVLKRRISVPVLDVYVNLARPLTEAELMHLVIRRVYEQLVEKDLYESLNTDLQRRITLAYQRTSANVVRKVTEGWERSVELAASNLGFFKGPISPKLTSKKSRTVDFETSFLAYDDKAAEHDVISIARSLALGIPQKEIGWRGFWRRLRRVAPSSMRVKIVFVFDEMDKLDDQTDPGGRSEVEKMLAGLKNLFTTSGICFLFIAGKDLHWLRDISRGDSVFESVFSYDKYLPCMWANVDSLCEQFTSVDGTTRAADPQLSACLENFKHYLRFKGRGIPRRIIRSFNELVAWQDGSPVLRFRNETLRRITFYAQLNHCLEQNSARLFGLFDEDGAGTRQDRLKLGVYYVVDWILLRVTGEFTAAGVLNASHELSSRISLAEEVAIGTISDLLDVLVEGEYLEVVTQQLDQVAINAGNVNNEKRYRLTPRRLAEISGIAAETEEEPAGPSRSNAGRTFGHYELQELLGQGGMGLVYRAWDTAKRRFVALKLLHSWLSANSEARERFRRELATLERLRHANIVSFLEAGEFDSQFFLAMDFIEGADLDSILKDFHSLPIQVALSILEPVGTAIEFAHSEQFLRLDVKPGNIRVSTTGKIYLMDLGIARNGDEDGSITQRGSYVGTPFYLAPEQVTGGSMDQRVDIYSFGLVLYETLTGRRPFEGTTVAELLIKHLHEAPVPPSQFVPVPSALEALILKCLAKSPEDRFQSMTDVLATLRDCQVGRSPAEELGSLATRVKRSYRHKQADTAVRTAATGTDIDSLPSEFAPSTPPSAPSLGPMPVPQAGEARSLDLRQTGRAATVPWVNRLIEGSETEGHPVTKEITSIGRDVSNDICLANADGVSRFHARILRQDDGKFLLADLNSSNGSFLNGVRIFAPAPLKNGDQMEIGNAQLAFYV
jgi:serine/threonine protein kinase/AAA+ ATPase superfamily predicted ATPase